MIIAFIKGPEPDTRQPWPVRYSPLSYSAYLADCNE